MFGKKPSRAFSLIELSIVILIVGIIIAGVTQSSRLVNRAKINSARSATQSSPVASISGLSVWWETTREESFGGSEPEDGATITNWIDINPQGTTKAQTTSTSAPTYKSNCINSLPCLNFNGSNFLNTTISSADLGVSMTQISMFAVVMPQSLSNGTSRYFIITNGPWVSGFVGLYVNQSSGGLSNRAAYTNWGAGAVPIMTSTAVAVGAPYVISQTDNGTSLRIFLNGGFSNAATPTVSIKGNSSEFYIGTYLNSGTRVEHFFGYIGEIIIFNRGLTTEERESVEEYLGKKWGVTIS
jgi:prepilin-type N-terminal cleavage/methylation domain-containing protein